MVIYMKKLSAGYEQGWGARRKEC